MVEFVLISISSSLTLDMMMQPTSIQQDTIKRLDKAVDTFLNRTDHNPEAQFLLSVEVANIYPLAAVPSYSTDSEIMEIFLDEIDYTLLPSYIHTQNQQWTH